jgi:hypothetical protein
MQEILCIKYKIYKYIYLIFKHIYIKYPYFLYIRGLEHIKHKYFFKYKNKLLIVFTF